ncbi:TldD/PmbA family protein [Prochlorococcus marinus]|uniref:Possible modulator of DNA gyrase n=1 Tax=Prochlorococcus marinus (strain MIT 9211) TaxID=93059 RepID=A9BAJ2_PROM4|nr:TldD/PmbA family protein [Prochlorococcus marinus]ABX08854.1 possible modulator of DNA gyrase [Prochlorococcus marinus str. MIT 9211]
MTKTTNDDLIVLNKANIKEKIDKISSELKIDKWDIGVSSSIDTSVQVFNGEPKQLKSSQRSSITIRVWNKNLVGITSTSDLSYKALKQAFTSAYQASEYGNSQESPDFSPLCNELLPVVNIPIRDATGVKYLYERLKQAESDLLNKHNSIDSVPYNGFSESDYERVYLNSSGSSRVLRNTQSSIYLYAKAQEKGRKPRSGGSIVLAHGSKEIDVDKCVAEAAEKTISHLNYKPIETGKYLVCFSPEAFLELLTAFSNIFNARSILDGISLSTKSTINTQVANPLLTLHDNGLDPSNFGAVTFDGEGTPTKDLCLIKNGVLKNLIHSEATAREFGVPPSGHAGLGAKVSVSPDWLLISRNKEIPISSSLDHRTNRTQFVLIEGLQALHAGIKPSQGSFSLPFDGWLVNNREKISIESATIAGDFKTLLKEIIEIEPDEIKTHAGVSPHVWVDGLSITGEK